MPTSRKGGEKWGAPRDLLRAGAPPKRAPKRRGMLSLGMLTTCTIAAALICTFDCRFLTRSLWTCVLRPAWPGLHILNNGFDMRPKFAIFFGAFVLNNCHTLIPREGKFRVASVAMPILGLLSLLAGCMKMEKLEHEEMILVERFLP